MASVINSQLELGLSSTQRQSPRGGYREGAGRKRTLPGKPRVKHRVRPAMGDRYAAHVTTRMRPEIARLRGWDIGRVVRRAFVYGCRFGAVVDGDRMLEFRICQFSIQGNHIHMICEATDNEALARGVQGWAVRVARGLNAFLEREGSVFVDRYHLEVLRNPTQTRNALCYVLQNALHHRERLSPRYNGIDPFSSAWWFDGWLDHSWREGVSPPEDRSVAEPRTWLLRVGWRRAKRGLISINEIPATRRH